MKDKRKMVEYEGVKMFLHRAVHQRMLFHYAIAEVMGHKDFSAYFNFIVFPRVSEERPYSDNKDGWKMDCVIKKAFKKVLSGFEKSVSIMGDRNFQQQLKPYRQDVKDKVSIMATLGPSVWER